MRTLVTATVLCLAMAPVAAPATAGGVNPDWSIARQWDEEALQAIRLATPRPPAHARTLYHLSIAIYDGWATYDPVAHGVFVTEKHTVADPAVARRETISYAAYRLLKARFIAGNGPNVALIQVNLDSLFIELGYDPTFTSTVGDSPAAIGNRIAATTLVVGLADGANEAGNYAAVPPYVPPNPPLMLMLDEGTGNEDGLWQPLAFDLLVLQNGEIIGAVTQTFTCPHWRDVTPFAMSAADQDPGSLIYFDQGPPPALGSTELQARVIDAIAFSAGLDSEIPATIDISPGVHHNSPLGTALHPGYGTNPVTGEPYAPNEALVADYHRAAAAFWLDGPFSTTPAGRWHEIANEVADTAGFALRISGTGPEVDRLEWDAKAYLAIGGAGHDAAIATWSAKRAHETARPISFVRLMGEQGQRSDPDGASYDPDGLPLVPGLVHVVTEEDVAPGGPLEELVDLLAEEFEPVTGIDDHVGDVVVRSWMDGLLAGALATQPSATAALPGHAYRDDTGWHVGGFDLGTNDSPGAPNPGAAAPRGVQLSEVRAGQPGMDLDEYVEIVGPPGADLDGIWLVVIGDLPTNELTVVTNGRVIAAVDLGGRAIGRNGVLVVGRSTMSIAVPDVATLLNIHESGSCTYALVTNFTGQLGDELDYYDDGELDVVPWTGVVDAVSLRRLRTSQAGLYLDAPIVGPDSTVNQRHGVGWVLARRWMPHQPRSVVSPASAAYLAESSVIARACAEALTGIAGTPYFAGGIASATVFPGDLVIEAGPSAPVTLQWASFFDAADEAGESRLWAGIQFEHDDLPGRVVGDACGSRATARALALFSGLAHAPDVNGDGAVDGADLGVLLAAWGAGGGPADLDGDGDVDGADLGALLAAWSAR